MVAGGETSGLQVFERTSEWGRFAAIGDLFGRSLMHGSYDNNRAIFILPVKEDINH